MVWLNDIIHSNYSVLSIIMISKYLLFYFYYSEVLTILTIIDIDYDMTGIITVFY